MREFKLVCIVVLSFCMSQRVFGQPECNHILTGKVFDRETNEPLPFVTVQIEGTVAGAKTALDGTFTLKHLCEGEIHLVISHIGYKQTLHHHDTHHADPEIFLAPDDVLLNSVVIEAESVKGDLESLKSTKLEALTFDQNSSSSFGQLAGQITGVNVLSTGQNVAKPIIHGLHSNRVLIINSGLRHEFQNWGTEHGPEIDPSLYESLEVIKGAATVRYGPDALGGVVLINPQKLSLDNSWNGEAKVGFQTNGRAIENQLKIQKGFHRFSFLAQGSLVKQGDLSAPDYILSNTGKEESSFAFSGRYHLPKIDIRADYIKFDQNLGILRGSITENLNDLATALNRDVPSPTSPFTYDINNPRQEVKHDLFRLSSKANFNGQVLNFQYGYQKNRRQEFDVRRGTNNERPSINLELDTHSFDVDWRKSNDAGWSKVFGSQVQLQNNRNIFGTNTAHFVPNYDQFRGGIFGVTTYEVNENTYEIGGRYDYQSIAIQGRNQQQDLFENDLVFQNVTLTLGYKRKVNNYLTFNTNLGSAWRPPNVLELYGFGKRQSSIVFGILRNSINDNGELVTNRVLDENEKNVTSEKGFKWIGTLSYFNEKVDGELTLYANYIQDYINARPRGVTSTVRGAFPFFVFQQNDALFMGVDYSLKYNHNSKLNSHLSGSYLWAKDVTNNSFFVGLPPASIAYQLKYQHPFVKSGVAYLTLKGSYNFQQSLAPQTIPVSSFIANEVEISPTTDDFDFLNPPNGYLLIDLYWQASFKNLELSININNLLDQSYRSYTNTLRYFSDELGRNLSIAVTYKFN